MSPIQLKNKASKTRFDSKLCSRFEIRLVVKNEYKQQQRFCDPNDDILFINENGDKMNCGNR
jgi:hypothetical protein